VLDLMAGSTGSTSPAVRMRYGYPLAASRLVVLSYYPFFSYFYPICFAGYAWIGVGLSLLFLHGLVFFGSAGYTWLSASVFSACF